MSAPATRVGSASRNERDIRRLDEYQAALFHSNPFTVNRVTEPSTYDVDVEEIHSGKFNRLTGLAEQALHARAGTGVALLGGAGVGKSHLLSRLYRWANHGAEGGGSRACYVYLNNVLADPDRLPRYLLKSVVSRLAGGCRGPLYGTTLYTFVETAFRHAIATAGMKADNARLLHDAYLAHFAIEPGGTPVYEVLYQFLRHARPQMANDPARRHLATQAIAWLSGDEIDPDTAKSLGIRVEGPEPVMLRDDEEVESVFLTLSRLARLSNQPFIVCVDQFENIDPVTFKPICRFFHALLDHASNLLLITSGVKQTLVNYREDGTIPEASWDRIAEYTVELTRSTRNEARKILEARLVRFHEPYEGLDLVRRKLKQDTLFPLGSAWFDDQFCDAVDARPRDVLSWARDAWEAEKEGLDRLGIEPWMKEWPTRSGGDGRTRLICVDTLIDDAVDRKLQEQVSLHRLEPGSLPPDAGNLAGLVEALLGNCVGEGLPYTIRALDRKRKQGSRLPPHDLLVRERRESDGRDVTTGVIFVTNVGISATSSLRRLLEDEKAPDHRVLVTDEERRPLKLGQQGVEYYRDLTRLGSDRFQHLKINLDQYAKLDALHAVIGMARSGDLEIETGPGGFRAVTEAEVISSHHRRDRYRTHPLLRPLLTEDPSDGTGGTGKRPELLDEKDVRQYIAAQLAWMMGSMARAIAKSYVEATKGATLTLDVAWPQVKSIAEKMHGEGLVHATPHDDDLYLLLRK